MTLSNSNYSINSLQRVSIGFLTLLFIFLFTSKSLEAQTSGVVIFEEDVTFDLPPEFKARMKDAPDSFQSKKILSFDGNEMSYVNKKEEKANPLGKRGRRMHFMRGSQENIKYYNFESGAYLEKANRYRKDFLIKDTIEQLTWKISASEQRDILGYTCMKALYVRDSTQIEAWFTPQIPVSFGPDGLHGLPGLILAVGYGENKAILAKEVSLDPEEKVEIKRLEENKDAMTRSDYDTLMEERREEMKKMWGGNSKRRKMRGSF